MASLIAQFAAGNIPSRSLRTAGATTGLAAQGNAELARRRRRRLIESAIREGKLDPRQVGPQDRATITAARAPSGGGDGFDLGDVFTGPAGFLKNLGAGIARTAAGLPGGIVTTGRSVLSDLYSQLPGGPEARLLGEPGSATRTNVIDPTVQEYKQRYTQGNFWRNFYEDPFPFLLDIGAVGSVGASAAARAGRAAAPRLTPGTTPHAVATGAANWVSRGGRAPLDVGGGNRIEREYTPRPVSRLLQRGIDRLGDVRGGENPIRRLQTKMEIRRQKRLQNAMKEATIQRALLQDAQLLRPWSELTPAEAHATILMQLGVNNPALVDELQAVIRETSLSDEAKMAAMENRGVDPAYVESMAEVSDEVRSLIDSPTETMIRATNSWRTFLEGIRGELGIDEKTDARHRVAAQDFLMERILPRLRTYYHGTHEEGVPDLFSSERFTRRTGEVLGPGEISPTIHAGTRTAASHRLEARGLTEGEGGVIVPIVPRSLRNLILNRPLNDADDASLEGAPQWADAQGMAVLGANPFEAALHSVRGVKTDQARGFEVLESTVRADVERLTREIESIRNRLERYPDNQVIRYQLEQTERHLTERQQALSNINELRRRAEEEFAKGPLAYRNVIEDPGSESIVGLKEQLAVPGSERIRTPRDQYPKPTYTPIREATGFRQFQPGLLSRMIPERFQPTGEFSRGPRDRSNPMEVTSQNLYLDPQGRYLHTSSLETFQTGSWRTDARLILDEAQRMRKDLIEKQFNDENFRQWAAKDENGEIRRFQTRREMEEALGPGWVLVPDKFPIAWFMSEVDHLKQVSKAYEQFQDEGGNLPVELNIEEFMEKITDADAKAFVATHWNAMKRKGVAMPQEVFDYDKAFRELQTPYASPVARFFARQLHRWRTLTLSYMPRWALNTAVGSFIMSSLRGVTPLDYREANRLNRTFVNPETNETVVQPSLLSRFFRRGENVDTTGMEPVLPPGVSLGQQAYHEIMDLAGPAYGRPSEGLVAEAQTYARKLGFGFPTRKILMAVQGIEDFFRRASFVRNLRREQQLASYERGPEVELLSPEGERIDETTEPTTPPPQIYEDPMDDPNSEEVDVLSKLNSATQRPEPRPGGDEATVEANYEAHISWMENTSLPVWLDYLANNQDQVPEPVLRAFTEPREGVRLVHVEDPDETPDPSGHPPLSDIFGERVQILHFVRVYDGLPMYYNQTVLGESGTVHDVSVRWDRQFIRENQDTEEFGEDFILNDTNERVARLMGSHIRSMRPETLLDEDPRPIKIEDEAGNLINDFTVEQALQMIQDRSEYDLDPSEWQQLDRQLQALIGDSEWWPEAAEIGEVLMEHNDLILRGYRGDIDQALQDPQVVQRALAETNKMMYNYGILGPKERRYVRQFIPFWGWYKFISMAAARLPVEFPGRVAMMEALATIYEDQIEDYGMMPPWLKGVIPLSEPEDKRGFGYLSTMGLNPFASFINPLSPKGLLAGVGTLGQGNPGIQALLSAAGYDTLTGDAVRISPDEGVGRDYLGRLRREDTGQDVSPMEVAPGRRLLMGLLRSLPQYRIGEQALEGSSVYPEHVPVIAPRPMSPTREGERTGMESIFSQWVGINPRTYDLANYQEQARKSAEYIETRNRNDRLRRRRRFQEASR